jgi:hypothetical protein
MHIKKGLAERGGDVATLLLMMMMRWIWAAKREVWAVEGEKGQRGTK